MVYECPLLSSKLVNKRGGDQNIVDVVYGCPQKQRSDFLKVEEVGLVTNKERVIVFCVVVNVVIMISIFFSIKKLLNLHCASG